MGLISPTHLNHVDNALGTIYTPFIVTVDLLANLANLTLCPWAEGEADALRYLLQRKTRLHG
jgi:hypothetical protein